jgi:hypothetical protein
MSEFLNSLNAPESAPAQSWAAEVAAAEAAEATQKPVEAAEPPAAPEPAAEQEAAPAPAQAEPEAKDEDERRVPLKALQEERQKRSEYERKLDEAMRRMAELEQRVPKQQEAPAEADPDPETDPIGALKRANEKLRAMEEATRQQQYEAHLNTVAYNAATQFSAQVPDYKDAYQYALKSRAMELAALGTPQNDIPGILKNEEMNLIARAVGNNLNPAAAIYEFAKARGYAPPAPAAPAAPVAAAPDPALQQAKKAVGVSASAGGAPASKGELSDAEMANLKGAAFDAAWQKRFGGNKSSMFRE